MNPYVWQPDHGYCHGVQLRYYFDRDTNQCLPFNYTGKLPLDFGLYWYLLSLGWYGSKAQCRTLSEDQSHYNSGNDLWTHLLITTS